MEIKQFKIIIGALGFLFLLTIVNTCNTCNNRRQSINIENKIDSLDGVAKKVDLDIMKDEINKSIQIECLKNSKRVLYDWNAIVRTVVRPDDRMNQYDIEINKLENRKSK